MKRIHDYAGRETVLDVEQREFLRGLVHLGVLDADMRRQIIKHVVDSNEICGKLPLKNLARVVVLMLHARRLGVPLDALKVLPGMHVLTWNPH